MTPRADLKVGPSITEMSRADLKVGLSIGEMEPPTFRSAEHVRN